MIINYEPQHIELEEEGHCNLVLIAARYVGDRSSINANRYRQQAAWPGYSPFQGGPPDPDGNGRLPGPAQGALIPDWTDEDTENRTVEALESDPDIEVLYREQDIARAMLEANYLDQRVFGMGFDEDIRERVFDALGLEEAGVRDMTEYRRQLREIAGLAEDPEQAARRTRDSSRVTEYRSEHTRAELITAATILGMDDPHGEGKIGLATWLADQDPKAVRFAFEGKAQAAQDVQTGEDVTESDPLTAADVIAEYEYDEIKAAVKAAREGTGEFSLRGADAESMAAFLVEDKDLTEAEIDAHLTE